MGMFVTVVDVGGNLPSDFNFITERSTGIRIAIPMAIASAHTTVVLYRDDSTGIIAKFHSVHPERLNGSN
jgi:hypothetical protein